MTGEPAAGQLRHSILPSQFRKKMSRKAEKAYKGNNPSG